MHGRSRCAQVPPCRPGSDMLHVHHFTDLYERVKSKDSRYEGYEVNSESKNFVVHLSAYMFYSVGPRMPSVKSAVSYELAEAANKSGVSCTQ